MTCKHKRVALRCMQDLYLMYDLTTDVLSEEEIKSYLFRVQGRKVNERTMQLIKYYIKSDFNGSVR